MVEASGQTLLGRETFEALSFLCIGPFQENNVGVDRFDSDVRGKYKHLYTNAGPLKGYQLKPHVDELVGPVAQSVLRIPFGL